MYRNQVKSLCGWIIIIGHLFSAGLVMAYLDRYMNVTQRIQVLLTLLPLTAAYFMSVVRNFVASQFDRSPGRRVNWNFAVLSLVSPLALIVFIDYLILTYPSNIVGNVQELQSWTAGVELVIGTALGLVVADLFPTTTEEGNSPAKTQPVTLQDAPLGEVGKPDVAP